MGNVKQFPELLTGAEVARIFRVDPKTVNRWTKSGRLAYACKTLGGHYRYSKTTVALMVAIQEENDSE